MFRNEVKLKQVWAISFLATAICFAIIIFFFFPVLNSGDDLFLMYQLAGGFGDAPTNLLHYDHIIHPWLGYILSSLFTKFPDFNWYTFFFLLCQWASWSIILYVLLNYFRKQAASAIFLLIFIMAGIGGIQSINMTVTAWLLSVASIFYLLLIVERKQGPKFYISLVLPMILIFIAGSIRLQVPLIAYVLFLPVCWIRSRVSVLTHLVLLVLSASLLYTLNFIHKQYYKRAIPGWQKEEAFRQDLFYKFNRPGILEADPSQVYIDKTEKAFFEHFFFYDTSFPSANRVKAISHASTRVRNLRQQDDRDALYWTWASWRLYFLCFAIILFVAWQQGLLMNLLRRVWLPLAFIFGFYLFLFFFLKITEAFHTGVLLLISLVFCSLWPPNPGEQKKNSIQLQWILFLLPLSWSLLRETRNEHSNRENHKRFLCTVRELRANRDKLFIATDDGLPLPYFYFADAPDLYPLTNLIYKDRLLTRSYGGSMERYGISDINRALYEDSKVYLLGKNFPELCDQLLKKYGISTSMGQPDSSFKCIEVRKIQLK